MCFLFPSESPTLKYSTEIITDSSHSVIRGRRVHVWSPITFFFLCFSFWIAVLHVSDALRSTKSWRKRTLPATVLRRRLLVSDSTGAVAGSQTCGCTRACVLDFICTSGRRKRGHRFHEPGFGTGGSVTINSIRTKQNKESDSLQCPMKQRGTFCLK